MCKVSTQDKILIYKKTHLKIQLKNWFTNQTELLVGSAGQEFAEVTWLLQVFYKSYNNQHITSDTVLQQHPNACNIRVAKWSLEVSRCQKEILGTSDTFIWLNSKNS